MLPWLALISIGPRRLRAVGLPVPLFLLWPVALLALIAAAIGDVLFARDGTRPWPLVLVRQSLNVFAALRGLRLEARRPDGIGVLVVVF